MEGGDGAYEVLGVSKDATESEIKKAYRKLALKHHPDKQTTDESRQQAPDIFAKISNAYEILSDPQQRQEYDNRDRTNNGGGSNNRRRPSANDFSSFGRGGGGGDDFHFHDPFEIFRRVFREEFGQQNSHNSFREEFGQQNSGGMGGMHGGFPGSAFPGSSFGASQFPFMGGGMMEGGRGSPFDNPFLNGGMGNPMPNQRQNNSFFGGFEGDPFASMNGGSMNGNMSSSFTMSSSSSGMVGNSMSTSTSTTTQVVNGRRQSVRETIIRKPDGTVERRVETDGDNQEQSRLPASGRTPGVPGGRRRPPATHRLSNPQLTQEPPPARKRARKSDNK